MTFNMDVLAGARYVYRRCIKKVGASQRSVFLTGDSLPIINAPSSSERETSRGLILEPRNVVKTREERFSPGEGLRTRVLYSKLCIRLHRSMKEEKKSLIIVMTCFLYMYINGQLREK